MESSLAGLVLPLLLLAAALMNWSVIGFIDLIAFLVFQLNASKLGGLHRRRRSVLLWSTIIFSIAVILGQSIFLALWTTYGENWSAAGTWWAKLFGLMIVYSWRSPVVIYFLLFQILAVLVALFEIYWGRYHLVSWKVSSWSNFSSIIEQLGYRTRNACCLLLPAVQLVVGISHPSWISLPFFIGSCAGLVDWSLTSNFLGLFRWWRVLWLYAGVNIGLIYAYQLPAEFLDVFRWIANYIGLYWISPKSEWPMICSGISLVLFYVMLSCVKNTLEEMEFIVSSESHLTERLLPSKYSFFVRESSSGVLHTNMLLRGSVFRTFSINFFTYGFPVSLFALSFWSFHFASICAFGLLAYVGYNIYAFPSLFRLHRLNGLLLVFILLWALGTYIFNVAFSFLKGKIGKDMDTWEMVGLWHYPIPGFFLLAQFCLGVLVALGNLVNNSVFLCLSEEYGQTLEDSIFGEVEKDTKVLIVATVAWGMRKCSRAITLALIFLIAMRPGFIHAVYMIFFLIYLLSHNVNRRIRQSMILLCEAHFALLYILRISLISEALEKKRSVSREILSQLGLLECDGWEFVEVALLACYCAIHNHGFDMLFSFSAIIQHSPSPPIGFSILKAGLNKSVLLSVYASRNSRCSQGTSSSERRIAVFLSAIGQKFLSAYRSCGTSIVFLTILLTVYLVKPNYISFGYIFILLIWIAGRQLVEKTNRRLWFPLKAYSISVFIFIYCLNTFSSFENWLSASLDLQFYLGYSTGDSLFLNVWQSLAVMIVMQLYSYERRQSKYILRDDLKLESGLLGFIRRLLIWHSDKILYAALFYASLSPISLSGFLYLVGVVVCCLLPKSSRVPSKLFLIYTGLLVVTEYLFQKWGMQAGMFPGQKHSYLATLLGFRQFGSGFWGVETGLRGKVLVIAACTLQYNVFRWLERIPPSMLGIEKWEEPCPLFLSPEEGLTNISIPNGEHRWDSVRSDSSPSVAIGDNCVSSDASGIRKSLRYFWGSGKESNKWNKKRILTLRRERLEAQMSIIKVYLKFWIENLFNLFGLEINMIALLLASFALLNAISMLYIALLAACVLLNVRLIRKIWPLFVFMFAAILILEYFAIWKNALCPDPAIATDTAMYCHECPETSKHLLFCEKCWLGLIVDDSRVLISYFAVFLCACLKLRADRSSTFSGSHTYRQVISQRKNIFVWRDLSFETKSMWTILDYLKLYCYCHLLDVVLALILITGTLEYDILHLGYLAFALVFFRMRLEILKKRNKVFRFLRMYNFAIIVLSLAYQSPFVGDFTASRRDTINYIFEGIGFHKYEYGFRITARSALVEIVIFILVALQSFMFSSQEFDYVSRYLEAEQIGAIVHEQEKKAAWKTAQLQHIREIEDKKRQRHMQVEKMKSEMLNLQIQLHDSISSAGCVENTLDDNKGPRRRNAISSDVDTRTVEKVEKGSRESQYVPEEDFKNSLESFHSPVSTPSESPPCCEITEIEEIADIDLHKLDKQERVKDHSQENAIKSAVQLFGDSVSQVQSIGNQAVNNLVNFLNIKPEETDSNENKCLDSGNYDEMESQRRQLPINRSSSVQSDVSSDAASLQIGRILSHIWAQMRSNNDFVCYCCFVLVFVWNFSLLSLGYLAALFLYALCVNTGPSYIFWIIMLIYTEAYILLEYLYQIIIQHHVWSSDTILLREFGFPQHKINSSFVVGSMPLFLVYLFTLIQSSITAKDGEWASTNGFQCLERAHLQRNQELWYRVVNAVKGGMRSFFWYLKSLIRGAESPPYFVQVSMDVCSWPDDGIQPDRIESAMNQLLRTIHNQRCREKNPNICPFSSRVHVQSIERSPESRNVALVVFEVIYASPLKGCDSAEWYRSLTPSADVVKEILRAETLGYSEFIRFPYKIMSVIDGGKREIDLYAYIFGADLTVFFLVAMFYQSIMKNKNEFLDVSQLEDQFPKDYVFILMVIFFLIVLDRVIYLCSFATCKVLFYLFNLILFTYSITKYAWRMGPSLQQAGWLALRAIFLAKAVSFALQAIQVRYGIPHQSTLYRQFLTSEVSRVNYLGYRLYRALPFLYELRCVLDWSCTTTSLTMYDWLKLEDINASLYLVKCDAILNRASHKQGEKQTKMTKCCSGICLFFFLICVIWAPMLMYSSGNPTNIANPIKDASVQVDIRTVAGKLTLYQTTLCEKLSWGNLKTNRNLDPEGYLDTFDKNDIQLICCQSDASSLWLVPDVVRFRYVQSLLWDPDMGLSFTWVLSRDRPKGKELVKYDRPVDPGDLPQLLDVVEVLNGSHNSFRVYNMYPRYFRVTGSGEVRPLEQEVNAVSADLILNRGEYPWWSFRDVNSSDVIGCGGLTGPMAIIVSEETPPQGILGDTLSKFSIWGLYITFVLAVGRFIRLQCSDLRMRIPYENLPSCDRLIAICEDIYSARAEGELGVEEVLYWTLVKIYRSPHMLLEYTKAD